MYIEFNDILAESPDTFKLELPKLDYIEKFFI